MSGGHAASALLALLSLASSAAAAPEEASRVLTSPQEEGVPVETAVGPRGELAWVTTGGGDALLRIGGHPARRADAIEDLHWTRDGSLVYWLREGESERIVRGTREGRAWDGIRTPDLEALARAGHPEGWSWTHRGGAQVALAARDPEDPEAWVKLLRRPSEPLEQERHPLASTRAVPAGPDPGMTALRPRRLVLLQGRVPFYVARDGRRECAVSGEVVLGCGLRIEMLAMARGTGRVLAAWREAEGGPLLLSDGLTVRGPYRRIDWAAFSPDGLRYAVLVNDGTDRILTDGGFPASPGGRLAALSFTAAGTLASLWNLPDRDLLLEEDRVLAEAASIPRFLRPPAGAPVPVLLEEGGYRPGPAAPGGFRSLWGEGFLPDGRLVAQATPAEGGGQVLIAGDRILARGDALLFFTPDEGGTRILSVTWQRDGGQQVVSLDGAPIWQVSEVGAAGFVGEGPAARAWIRHHPAEGGECLRTELLADDLCCPEVLGWSGSAMAPVLLCRGPGETYLRSPGAEDRPVDELPGEHAVASPDGRLFWFVSRKETSWTLHAADGRREPLAGAPRMLLAGRRPGDRPWLLLDLPDGRVTLHDPEGGRQSAEAAFLPHVLPGLDAVFRVRDAGREAWETPLGRTPWAEAMGSPPLATPGGAGWWERRGGLWRWMNLGYDHRD